MNILGVTEDRNACRPSSTCGLAVLVSLSGPAELLQKRGEYVGALMSAHWLQVSGVEDLLTDMRLQRHEDGTVFDGSQ